MKAHSYLHLLRIFSLFFFFFLSVISPSLAQEKLPEIVKRVQPSVVVILTYDEEGKIFKQGSGFFINQNGDIITNRHVLQGANRAEIKTIEGKIYPITSIVSEDKEGDLVRVSADIPPKMVHPIRLSHFIPEVGERVIVIGNPLGLEQTVSDGIVSAVRDIPEFGKIIQITVPISPGSSGSPVVNMKGEIIGVVTFQIIKGQNLNFAIPSERVAKLKPKKGKTFAEWKAGTRQEWLASAEGLYFTGLVYLWIEDYEKALSYFEKAVKKNPRYADAYFEIGYCNGQLGRYTEEIEAYKQAIRIKPDYAEAHFGLGAVYGQLGRYTEEIEANKQAIRIKPDYAEAHLNLGWVYGQLGRYTEAIEAYKQAIRIKPDYAKAHLNLGATYLIVGDKGSALDEYKILKGLNRNSANKLFNLIYR